GVEMGFANDGNSHVYSDICFVQTVSLKGLSAIKRHALLTARVSKGSTWKFFERFFYLYFF
ncbi:MAG: hypothetical protein NZM41_08570, partial [Saprospiraceae bacterium]|nr:hypothetical protein [Saprospiraceae bacterium]